MHRLAIVGAGLLAVSLVLLLTLHPGHPSALESLVPSDVIAVAVISSAPPDLDFLRDARLKQWVDIDVDSLRSKIPDGFRNEIGAMFQQDLDTAWILVHGLERREDAWRPEFTMALVPKPLHQELLELRIQLLAMRLFKATELSVAEKDNLRVYRGSRNSQTLFQLRMPGLLLVSNTDRALAKTVMTWSGQAPSLAQVPGFRRVRLRLPTTEGFFLYVNTGQILPLLPEFGYSMQWQHGEVVDQFYAAPQF
jgi:hypothetical protein